MTVLQLSSVQTLREAHLQVVSTVRTTAQGEEDWHPACWRRRLQDQPLVGGRRRRRRKEGGSRATSSVVSSLYNFTNIMHLDSVSHNNFDIIKTNLYTVCNRNLLF